MRCKTTTYVLNKFKIAAAYMKPSQLKPLFVTNFASRKICVITRKKTCYVQRTIFGLNVDKLQPILVIYLKVNLGKGEMNLVVL